tara:strand:- start:5098 stop:5427 length:330 start_codon:yes stop_codon:yes gene_type:complete
MKESELSILIKKESKDDVIERLKLENEELKKQVNYYKNRKKIFPSTLVKKYNSDNLLYNHELDCTRYNGHFTRPCPSCNSWPSMNYLNSSQSNSSNLSVSNSSQLSNFF